MPRQYTVGRDGQLHLGRPRAMTAEEATTLDQIYLDAVGAQIDICRQLQAQRPLRRADSWKPTITLWARPEYLGEKPRRYWQMDTWEVRDVQDYVITLLGD